MIGEEELFLRGWKPGLFIGSGGKTVPPRLAGYPSLNMGHNARLYLQTEAQKQFFLTEGLRGALYEESVMGRVLGIPEIAIRDYMEGIPQANKWVIDYHGFSFVVHARHVKEALADVTKRMAVDPDLAKERQSCILFFEWKENKWTQTHLELAL